jgi:hypothetical protein
MFLHILVERLELSLEYRADQYVLVNIINVAIIFASFFSFLRYFEKYLSSICIYHTGPLIICFPTILLRQTNE